MTGYEGTSAGPYSLSIGRLSDAPDRPPAAPTDPSPADLSVANPTSVGLAWRVADGSLPEAYDVLVRDSSGGLVSSAEGLSQPRLSLSGLVSDETYTWAVRSSDGSGRMAQGPTWRFSVGLTDPYEPDDSSDAAGVISPSVPQVRAFSSDADVDRARFGARAGQSYRASASAATIEPIAPARLAIVDLDGHELASGLGAVTLTPSADSVLQVVCTPAEGAGFYRLDLDGPSPEPHGMRVRCEHDALIHGDELHLMGEVLDEHGIPVPGVPYAVTVGPPGQEPQAGPFESVTDSGGVIDMRLTDLGRQLGLLEALVEAGALSARAGFTVSFRHVLPPPEGAARLRMATAPVGGTPETVFGLGGLSADAALASYLPEEERYRIHTGVEVAVEPGRGYFLYQAVPLTLSADAGMLPDPATHFVVALGRGWNIIGNPFARPILWSLDGFGVRRDGERVGSLREAADRGLIDPYGWAWDPQTDTYQLVFDAGSAGVTKGALDPYEAVWIYARERGLGLEIPPPSPHRASAEAAQRGSVDSSVLRLRVSTESGDSRELIAAFDGQTGIEGAAPPAPPGAAAAIRAEFVDGVQAGALGHLCRGRSVELVVQAGEAPGRFSLSWPDMRSLDREIKPTLEDMTAGRAYSLRTSRPLYIDLGVGEARHFRLTWTVADAWLRLAILDAQSGARGATVRGHLSRAATLEARVMNQAGRIVRRLVLGDHGAGEIEVHWNGRDDRGSSVPAGVYALELIADADDGEHASVRTQVMR